MTPEQQAIMEAHKALSLSRWGEPDDLLIRISRPSYISVSSEYHNDCGVAVVTTTRYADDTRRHTFHAWSRPHGRQLFEHVKFDMPLPPEFVAFMDEHFRREG